MKKSNTILPLMAIIVFCFFGFSQNTVEKNEGKDLITEIGTQTNIIGLQMFNTTQTTMMNGANNIYIEQIGTSNTVDVKTNTNSGNIEVIQSGTQNTIRMNVAGLVVSDQIKQSGSDHFFSQYANTPSLIMQRQINQNGYNQSLTIHGNNSISEKIRLNMNGSLNNVIIRNFK